MPQQIYVRDAIFSFKGGHLQLQTQDSNKNVRVNVKTFTTAASIIGLQVKPAAGVAMTQGCIGIEVSPRVNSGYAAAGIIAGIFEAWKRGNDNNTGVHYAIEAKLSGDTGYTGTVTGPAACLRAINSMHGTVTTGPAVIYAHNHEGNTAWAGFLIGAEALGTHSLTTSSDKTANGKSGTIKVRFNNTLYHIQLYADS